LIATLRVLHRRFAAADRMPERAGVPACARSWEKPFTNDAILDAIGSAL